MLELRWKSCCVFPLQLRNFKLVNSKLKSFPVATTICCGVVQHKINEKTTMQQQPTKHKSIQNKKIERKGTRTQDQGKQKCQKGTKAEINVAGRQPRTQDQGPGTSSPDRITCWPRAYCNSNYPTQVLPKNAKKIAFSLEQEKHEKGSNLDWRQCKISKRQLGNKLRRFVFVGNRQWELYTWKNMVIDIRNVFRFLNRWKYRFKCPNLILILFKNIYECFLLFLNWYLLCKQFWNHKNKTERTKFINVNLKNRWIKEKSTEIKIQLYFLRHRVIKPYQSIQRWIPVFLLS